MSSTAKEKIVLITGGFGFIGSHVAAALYRTGARIRIADIIDKPAIGGTYWHEFKQGDLRDPSFCYDIVDGVHTVLHFAANMGGMGTIHHENAFIIYRDNHLMVLHLIDACLKAGVQKFFYASSACVYPNVLQAAGDSEVSLREGDIWKYSPPSPQGLYGLEKLHSEFLVQQFSSKLDVRIARFHNIFGHGGAWRGGREKAPAAMLRKALACSLLKEPVFEVWGDGKQSRSFLYIDDAVEAVLKLLESECREPVNVGSDSPVTIQTLAEIALGWVGLDPNNITFSYDLEKPVGVASRNSNNDFVTSTLGWTPSPSHSLKDHMKKTGVWIRQEVEAALEQIGDKDREAPLRTLCSSQMVHLTTKPTTFGILLPITSRGSSNPSDCLNNLACFAKSFVQTTHNDTRQTLHGQRYEVVVYLGIDHDDVFLDGGQRDNRAEQVLRREGLHHVCTLIAHEPKGHVCAIWRNLAKRAWEEGCDYMVLMGDDVVLHDDGWLSTADAEFAKIAASRKVPRGFGCVAFTDVTFPGMPTFPIVHRTHLDIFHGRVVPDVFINQDGDPFLFQLYRRWGCSSMFPSTLSNGIGGEGVARYEKMHAKEWTFEPLETAVSAVELWFEGQGCSNNIDTPSETVPGNINTHIRKITLDVVVPCYRVIIPILQSILNLESPPSCDVMFIVIIDNPSSPDISALKDMFEHRPDVRTRVNGVNMGASESRNRGIRESAADWVHFLDDDIEPRPDLLFEAEKIIRKYPDAAGFVGNVQFPVANSIFTSAVHLAGVTYFWDIATKIDKDVPWGVTANLIARRAKDGIEYDKIFPKTGGGEDIDYCRKKREYSLNQGRDTFFGAPDVVVTHPWWYEGKRSYWRFYMWSVGDGALIKLYPNNTYRDHTPNSAELICFCVFSMSFSIVTCQWSWFLASLQALTSVIFANVVHDGYRHLWRDAHRVKNMKSTTVGIHWLVAVVESTFIRMFSEMGRLRGILGRKEWAQAGRRFDWFAGRWGDGPMNEERLNGKQRLALSLLFICMFWFSKQKCCPS
ncbi:hypothetical protein VNI00_003528 [Paramarasmius palmivorus]|uniref:Glycosyltransferase family 2 protein n=1 Tax=Paramarasmius palmivorus TaxID=297713 RepID=A0AAW0DPF5_9AGAR